MLLLNSEKCSQWYRCLLCKADTRRFFLSSVSVTLSDIQSSSRRFGKKRTTISMTDLKYMNKLLLLGTTASYIDEATKTLTTVCGKKCIYGLDFASMFTTMNGTSTSSPSSSLTITSRISCPFHSGSGFLLIISTTSLIFFCIRPSDFVGRLVNK